jgi:copper chaperone
MKFTVPDMSCGHCTNAIEKAIKAADAGADVHCDLGTHTVSVSGGLSANQLGDILRAAGYDNSPAA